MCLRYRFDVPHMWLIAVVKFTKSVKLDMSCAQSKSFISSVQSTAIQLLPVELIIPFSNKKKIRDSITFAPSYYFFFLTIDALPERARSKFFRI